MGGSVANHYCWRPKLSAHLPHYGHKPTNRQPRGPLVLSRSLLRLKATHTRNESLQSSLGASPCHNRQQRSFPPLAVRLKPTSQPYLEVSASAWSNPARICLNNSLKEKEINIMMIKRY